MADRCVGTNKSGGPCGAKPLPGSDRCPWHDPAWDERRREWSRRGGKGKSNEARARKTLPAGVMTNEELLGLVGVTIKAVLSGRVEPGIGNSVASLSKAYIAIAEAGAVETLQAEVNELRDLIASRGMA
jgi:hypothetical protein